MECQMSYRCLITTKSFVCSTCQSDGFHLALYILKIMKSVISSSLFQISTIFKYCDTLSMNKIYKTKNKVVFYGKIKLILDSCFKTY